MTTPIGEVILNGVLFDMKNWGNKSLDVNRLPEIVERLFEILIK